MIVMTRYESGRKFSGVRRDHHRRPRGCHHLHHRLRGSRHRLLLREEPSSRRLHRRGARRIRHRHCGELSSYREALVLNNRHAERNMLRPDSRRAVRNIRRRERSSCESVLSSYLRRVGRCSYSLSRRGA